MKSYLTLFSALLAVLCCVSVGCQSPTAAGLMQATPTQATPAQATPTPPQAAPAPETEEPQQVSVKIPGEPDALTDWVIKRWGTVPADVRDIKPANRTLVHQTVDSVVVASGHHLASFPRHPGRLEVLLINSQARALNRARYRSDFVGSLKEMGLDRAQIRAEARQEMKTYIADVLGGAETVMAMKPDSKQQARAHVVLADCYTYQKKHDEAAENYKKCFESDPDGPYAERAGLSLIKAYLEAGAYDDCRAEAPRFLKRFQRNNRLADIIFLVHQANRRDGRLLGGEKMWDSVEPYLVAGARGLPMPGQDPKDPKGPWIVPEKHRNSFVDYLGRMYFYRAFLAFARGEYKLATDRFVEFFKYYDSLAGSVPQALKVYRQFQAVPYDTTITALIDRPAPALGVGENWAGKGPATGDSAPGYLLLFANKQNANGAQEELLGGLDDLAEELGFETIWISTPGRIKEDDPEMTLEARQNQLSQSVIDKGFKGLSGLDVERALHEEYFINPGTANLFVLDGKGLVKWHLIYPTHLDTGLIRSVMAVVADTE